MGKYFGTDGIRGRYGIELTDDIAYMTGNALTINMRKKLIVLGRDTRVSGEALTKCLIKGIQDGGGTVIDLGIIPTPAVAYVTQLFSADYGIVISASHNPPQYNGLKIFNRKGIKLTESEEILIEGHIDGKEPHICPSKKGVVIDDKSIVGVYEKFLTDVIDGDLKGMTIVLDTANGASGQVAPAVYKALGANVFVYNDSQDGNIINKDCGALYPKNLSSKILENKADIGFSYDGDADRVIALNEKGEVIDGDDIIYIIALDLKERGLLRNNTAAGTVHTNLGVENELLKNGIKFIRTDVGDHNVVQAMVWNDLMIGGEQSGHIIDRMFSSTGDGVLASIVLCDIIKRKGKKLSELSCKNHYPQVNINVVTEKKNQVLSDSGLNTLKAEIEARLKGKGRVLLRASGTEPKVRIMVEAQDAELARSCGEELKKYVESLI